MTESATVVKIVRWVSRPSRPIDGVWLQQQLHCGIDRLNEFLLGLGMEANDTSLFPLTDRVLPPLVMGYQGDLQSMTERGTPPDRFILLTPRAYMETEREFSAEEVEEAVLMLAAAGNDKPFRKPAQLGFAAQRALREGDGLSAVVLAATSVETMASIIIRMMGPWYGYSTNQVRGALNAGFRNQVDHLGKILDISVDIDDPSSPWGRWWRDCYILRNRLVHEGIHATRTESDKAIHTTNELMMFMDKVIAASRKA